MYYSQSKEDEFLNSRVFFNKKNGVYVEVGSIDGVLYSNTKFFEDTLNWSGILIEPHPLNFELLKKNRPNNILFNNLISKNLDQLKYRYFIECLCSTSGVESEDSPSNFYFENTEDPIYFNQPRDSLYLIPKTLTEIVKTTNLTHIDFLSLDVVGHEYEVLQGWDFSIPIDAILIGETTLNISKKEMCKELIIKNGYKLYDKIGTNEIYILENSKLYYSIKDPAKKFISFIKNVNLDNKENLENYKNKSIKIILPKLDKFDKFHNNLLENIVSFFPSEKLIINNVDFNSNYDFMIYTEQVFIFTPLTYLYFIKNLNDDNFDNACNFLFNIKYIFIYYEVLVNNSLDQIGIDFRYIGHTLTDNFKLEYFKFLFFKRAGLNLLCNYRNITYLKENGIKDNVIYFPVSHINKNNIINQEKKDYDVIFYGNQPIDSSGQHVFPYRNKILTTFCDKAYKNNLRYVISNSLYSDNKNDLLSRTAIVIHIPSHEKLHTFPWAKVGELMSNKIFFIIEENEDLVRLGLEDKIAWYKHGDVEDLFRKVIYYKNNEDERNKITEYCYLFINTNYNTQFIYNMFF